MNLLIITPTLGTSPWLGETVDSVMCHAPRARHLLVGPARIQKDMQVRYPTAEFVAEEPDRGMYAAINVAARCGGDWKVLGYINDDDQLESGFRFIADRADKSEAIVYGNVQYVDSAGRNLGRLPLARPWGVRHLLSTGRAPFTQQGTLIPRAIWEALGGFDPKWSLAADYDFWCRAVLHRSKFVRIHNVVASFRLHQRQLSAQRVRMCAEIEAIRCTHFPRSRRALGALALWSFRVGSLRYFFERRLRAGVWTSAALYQRYSVRA